MTWVRANVTGDWIDVQAIIRLPKSNPAVDLSTGEEKGKVTHVTLIDGSTAAVQASRSEILKMIEGEKVWQPYRGVDKPGTT